MQLLKMTSVRNNICWGEPYAELHYRLMTTTRKLSLTVALFITTKCWKQPCYTTVGEQGNQLCPVQPLMEQSTVRIRQGNAHPLKQGEEKKNMKCHM